MDMAHIVYILRLDKKVGLDPKLEGLEKSIVKHQSFYETVDDELNPIKHPFQNTEENFFRKLWKLFYWLLEEIHFKNIIC